MSSSSDDCVCDYYCEVGVREHLSPAEGSNSGAYISKSSADKSNIALLTTLFEPTVLLRIPTEDRPGAGMKFAPEVAMFCFPHGVRLVTPDEAAVHAIPVVTSFVLTAADKSRMYGACIVWYEQLPSEVVFAFLEAAEALPPDGAPQPVVHAPEAVCLLSRVPIFEALMECCRQLFRMRISSNGALSAEALAALLYTPLPPMGRSVSLPLGNVSVPFSVPAANELPHTMAGRDFLHLFQCLDVNNVIMLWALLLSEQKVVLQSKTPHVLTMAAETCAARRRAAALRGRASECACYHGASQALRDPLPVHVAARLHPDPPRPAARHPAGARPSGHWRNLAQL